MDNLIYFLPFVVIFLAFFYIERGFFYKKNKQIFALLENDRNVVSYGRVWMIEQLKESKIISTGEYVHLYSFKSELIIVDDISLDLNYLKKKYCVTRLFTGIKSVIDSKEKLKEDNFRRIYKVNDIYFNEEDNLIILCKGYMQNYLSVFGFNPAFVNNYKIKLKMGIQEKQRLLENVSIIKNKKVPPAPARMSDSDSCGNK